MRRPITPEIRRRYAGVVFRSRQDGSQMCSGMGRVFLALLYVAALNLGIDGAGPTRSFTVDYANDRFLKDGHPFRYISGSLHYFRVPREYWRDRMEKMRLAGLNALQTYVEWSGHEPEPGTFNFRGDYDLKTFLDTANDVGLLVILRPGPYICAERDNGGLPYWLLRLNPQMQYRSSDPSYTSRVEKWFHVLLPMVEPYLYNNGGPIIALQVENEYGQYVACDKDYMRQLVGLFGRYLGQDVVLFRTDTPGDAIYECDRVRGTLPTADFGASANVTEMFSIVRRAMGRGPLVVTEYYPGWLDLWGFPHAKVDHRAMLKTLEEILLHNASVNLYMFHGGTNFGFTNGASPTPQTTSYDYGAPLTEAGDPAESYFNVRDVVGRYLPVPNGTLPVPAPKLNLGSVNVPHCASLHKIQEFFRQRGFVEAATSRNPKTFEDLGAAYGYVLYTTSVTFRPESPAILQAPGIKDRGYVMTAQSRAVIDSRTSAHSAPVVVRQGENVTILVENTGRINVGVGNHDPKGILTNVTLDKRVLLGWTMEPVPVSNPDAMSDLNEALHSVTNESRCSAPGAFYGFFAVPHLGDNVPDTFLDTTGWGKGVAFVNGFNLGRYWPSIGPQVTLYVPGVLLQPFPSQNTILLFETESAPRGAKTVRFVDMPNIDGPVPEGLARSRVL
ncbi:beta-galactosidase-like [Dermacentor andersoni]|uniref:beta-galactosidase-like n=1 Tax=Dermacentor andersoni TaxID=34620 RepID=UPI002155263F|nr:beta-galactosidase-like [Dermacentor andersoni]